MGGRLHHVVSQDDYHTYQDNSYTYDANGNIASISDLVAGAPQTQVFTYDAIDRLFSTAVSGGYNGNYIETNTYNTAGKLVTNGEGTRTYSTTQPHAATALGAEGFSYDENGNQKTRDYNSVNYTLTYDAENRLVMIFETGTDPQVTTGEYTYDGDGKRVLAKVNNVTTRYLDNYYEASSFGVTTEVTKYYYAGSQRVAWRVGEVGLYFGFGDHLGSTSVAVDADTGNITGSELYKAWGGERYTYGSLNTDYKYTGQRQAEAGLYFYDARWYDPKVGRFIQADSIIPEPGNPLAWDRYAYANNNPLYYTDPSGHSATVGEGGYDNDHKNQAEEDAQRNRQLYCQAGNTLYCSYAQNHPVEYATSMAVGLVAAGIAPEIPALIDEFGWFAASQCAKSLACWRALSILTGVGAASSQGNTDVIPDEAFVKFDRATSDLSISERGLDVTLSRDGRLWLTQYKYAKQFLNADPAKLEQVLFSQVQWQMRQGEFASGATLRQVMIDTATPAGITNMVNGIPQWYITSSVPPDLLNMIWRIFP